MRKILFVILILVNIRAIAQKINSIPGGSGDDINTIEVPNYLPPSPTASELGRFALVGNSLSTGSMNTHIELFNYKTKNLSVPVSLDYSTNGLKVDMVSSRAGMNWVLNAGGVISRTIFGGIDESTPFATVPSDFPNTTGQALKSFLTSVTESRYDTQPDIFTFNFGNYSGRFIIAYGNIKKLEQSNLEISGNTQDGFTIRTPDGIAYSFRGVVEASTSISSENLFYKDRIDNAWFLTSITHPDGDLISFGYAPCTFNYIASKNNAYVYSEGGDGSPCGGCANISTHEVVTTLRNYGYYLQSIGSNSPASGSLQFNYAPRTDIQGDYFLTSIVHYNNQNQPVKTSSFEYENTSDRFFLNKLLVDDQPYAFEYYNLDEVPKRLSYSQDHYGFFNGKNNESMIPKPLEAKYITAFSSRGFGDRSPDANYAKMGSMKKITYPTGGYDSLEYEANTVYTNQLVDCDNPSSRPTINVYGSSSFKQQNIYTSDVFTVNCNQTVAINIGCNANSHAGDGRPRYPNGEYLASAEIKDLGTGKVISRDGMDELQAVVDQHKVVYQYLPPGDYRVTLTVRGDAGGSMNFEYAYSEPSNGILKVSGVRLKKVTSYDPIAQKINIKKYYYDDPVTHQSTGVIYNSNPSYDSRLDRYISCRLSGASFLPQVCHYTKFSSTPNFGITNLSGNFIYYSTVTEGYGEDFENGGVEHTFDLYTDGYPALITGYSFYQGPIANSGVHDQALETGQRTFKKLNGNVITLKNIVTHYKDDPRLSERKTYFSIYAEPTSTIANTSLSPVTFLSEYRGIDVTQYDLVSKWIYPDTVKTFNYDADGLNPVVDTTIYEYNNTAHQLVNSIQHLGSDRHIKKIEYLYPQDNITGLSATAEAARQQLITEHDISEILEQSESVQGALKKKRINFKKWSSTITAPEVIEVYNKNVGLEERLRFYAYDNQGNVLSQGLVKGLTSVYIWSYAGFYPVAEIKNADYATVQSILGISNIENFSKLASPDKTAIENFVAPLKVALPNVQITTFVYTPLVGIISQTDPKGQTTYYEHDNFRRLMNIKDQSGNVVENYQYNYKGIPPPVVYWNVEKSQVFTRNDCPSGQGNPYTYKVNAGTYSSMKSQSDADIKALSDISLNGQAAANLNGTCMPPPCYGYYQKIVNGICETGRKIYTSSKLHYEHAHVTYDCIYHVIWSDGSISEDYAEVSEGAPCF